MGSCHACHVFTAPVHPKAGETVIGDDYHVVVGGKGSGQAVVACRLGSEVYILEHLGNDIYGRGEKSSYEKMGMHTDFVYLEQDVPTGMAGIFLNADGENKIIVVPGANSRACCDDVDRSKAILKQAKLLGAQLELPLPVIEYALRTASQLGVRTLLDPAPVTALRDDLYPCISIIKPNEHEASALTGIAVTDAETAMRAGRLLLEKGVREAAIITLGEKGVVLVTRTFERFYPVIPVKAVDTGGAGDTFAGALLAALAQDWPLEKAVCYAQCAATLCVTRTESYARTDKAEVDALFRERFGAWDFS